MVVVAASVWLEKWIEGGYRSGSKVRKGVDSCGRSVGPLPCCSRPLNKKCRSRWGLRCSSESVGARVDPVFGFSWTHAGSPAGRIAGIQRAGHEKEQGSSAETDQERNPQAEQTRGRSSPYLRRGGGERRPLSRSGTVRCCSADPCGAQLPGAGSALRGLCWAHPAPGSCPGPGAADSEL
ncbi:hypothetical protein NDU88_001034 [Pleurodeles waltl]|uniref:Uncharacterized protein n=1 Tax=Pleurodeles waltl TaxID=8319 RepID=A0AAV7LBW8_PLEWA|nr:hypothetical protein NDU88_001034 [Pleurodeles waltl]